MNDPLDFEVTDPGKAPSQREVPPGQHPWAPTAIAHGGWAVSATARLEQLLVDRQTRERAFRAKILDGERRYLMDPLFHRRVDLIQWAMFPEGPDENELRLAIRAVVALEESEGGVLDLRVPLDG